jgi:hypothetical protein
MGKRANKKKEEKEKEKEQNNVFQGNVSSFGDTSGKLAGSFSRKSLPCIETISFQLIGVLVFKRLDPV